MTDVTTPAAVDVATSLDLTDAERLLEEAGLVRDGFATCVAAGTALVARDADGTLVGVVATERFGGDVLLRSLAVRAGERGHGLGGVMVARALDDARRGGGTHALLLTEAADAFFAARDWAPADRADAPPDVAASVEFATACSVTARAMRRAL